MHILYISLWDPIKVRVQNGVSGSYMDVVLELVLHKESEIWKSLSVLPRKVYYSCQVSRVCVATVKVEIQALLADGMIE